MKRSEISLILPNFRAAEVNSLNLGKLLGRFMNSLGTRLMVSWKWYSLLLIVVFILILIHSNFL